MDVFKFTGPANGPMQGGQLVLPSDSVTWVERYAEAGEVKIVAPIGSGLREQLPVGTFVSHTETREVVKIEDHDIADSGGDEDPTLTITGRSMEAPALENRAAGSNRTFPTAAETLEYKLAASSTQYQALELVTHHIEEAYLVDDRDAIPYFGAVTTVGGTLTVEERTIKPGGVYARLQEILAVDKLGVKIERPATGMTDTRLVIHKGMDRSNQVVMSVDKGDVVNAAYLESDRKVKNCALLIGKFVQHRLVLNPLLTGYDRRWMTVDCSDIDEGQETIPTGDARGIILYLMEVRGREALAKQKRVELTKAEASHDTISAVYRRDYNVGDIVMVTGGYGAATKMRVTEYVEIQDETGFTGYPTLETLEEEDTP